MRTGLLVLLAVAVAVCALGFALAQGGAEGWVSEAGGAWIAAALAFAAAGTPVTREVVSYLLGFQGFESWLRERFGGNGIRFLAFVVALAWTAFWFQPGLLNLPALLAVPWWASIPILAAVISSRAGGQVDAARGPALVISAAPLELEPTSPKSDPGQRGS